MVEGKGEAALCRGATEAAGAGTGEDAVRFGDAVAEVVVEAE